MNSTNNNTPIKQLYKWDSDCEDIFSWDSEYCEKVEPMLYNEWLERTAVAAELEHAGAWASSQSDSARKTKNKTETKYYERETFILNRLEQITLMQCENLSLKLRILELIHKYNLTKEIEE